ncbi:MAG: type II toxin-antitoxin system RelE/ParE family toxin [Thermomicrobiales bacterium]
MSARALLEQAKKLPTAQRVLLVERIWDSIAEEQIGMTPTAEQLRKLDRRDEELGEAPGDWADMGAGGHTSTQEGPPFRLIFHPLAVQELEEAYDWYEKQKLGLGDDLLLCIEAGITNIRGHPFRYPVIRHDKRRVLADRFPYAIYYRVVGDVIRVLAVHHGSRKPSRWQRRK